MWTVALHEGIQLNILLPLDDMMHCWMLATGCETGYVEVRFKNIRGDRVLLKMTIPS